MKIATNEVHLWYARDEEITDNDLLTEYCNLLSEEERIQQQRFYFQRHRHQYLVTRALVRYVLSLYVDAISPDRWIFGKNEYNKPYIKNNSLQLPLNFNLSHTEKMIVLAVALENNIGVDVEFMLRRTAHLDIAERYFSKSEFQELRTLPIEQQKERFFDLWTLKEAYIKACGMGLAIPLDHFSYSFPGAGEVQILFDPNRDDHPRYWGFWQIKPNKTHVASLAVQSTNAASQHYISMREIVPLKSIKKVDYPIAIQSQTGRQDNQCVR